MNIIPALNAATEERARLAKELEKAQAALATLNEERARLDPGVDIAGGRRYVNASLNPRYGEVLRELGEAESKVQSIQDQIAYQDKIIAHETNLAGAVTRAQDARTKMEVATTRLGELKAQIKQLAGKIETLNGEADTLEADAKRQQEQAVNAYAEATATADAKAEKAAQAKLDAAQETTLKASIAAQQKRGMAEALRRKAEELAGLAEVASTEAKAEERRMMSAIHDRLGHEFNVAAQDLFDLLARICRAREFMGQDSHYLLMRLHLPSFDVDGRGFGSYDVQKRVAGIGFDDLLAELDAMTEAEHDPVETFAK